MAGLAAPRATAAAMLEDRGRDSLYAHVCEIMTELGLWHFHKRNSIGSAPGWPDLVILGPSGGLFRELKVLHGRLSPDQKMVSGMLRFTGFDFAKWDPADLYSGRIRAELEAIAAPRREV